MTLTGNMFTIGAIDMYKDAVNFPFRKTRCDVDDRRNNSLIKLAAGMF